MYIRQLALFCFFLVWMIPKTTLASYKAATQEQIPAGSRIKILVIDSKDSNYGDRYKYVGRLGTVEKGNLNKSTDKTNFYSGDIELDSGEHLNAWRISVAVLSSPAVSKGTRYTGAKVASGAWFRVLEIGSTDPAYSSRGKVIGQLCFAGYDMYQSYLTVTKGHYYGTVYCLDGSTKYFQDVSVELYTDTMNEKPLIMGSVPLYTRVKIVDISPKDPAYSKRASLLGKEGFVSGTGLTSSSISPSGKPYYTGNIAHFVGYSYTNFTAVELSTFEPNTSGSLLSGPGIIPVGTKVEIQLLGPLDRYYSKRREIEGLFGVVGASDALYLQTNGSYAGSIMVLGVEHKFSDVMVMPIAGGISSSRDNGDASLEPGHRVLILDVSKRDANAKDKAEVIGQVGQVINASLVPGTVPWYSGSILSDSGRFMTFTQVAILSLGPPVGPPPKKETLLTGPTAAAGIKVRILEIGPSDPLANSEKKLLYVSKVGTITYSMYNSGTSLINGGNYYSGSITIDGLNVNFYQVSLNQLE